MQHVVIRRWSGAAQLMAEMERRRDEAEQLIRGVPGFGAYYAVRTGANELVSITVCDDRAGTDESTRRAREWVQQNIPGIAMSPPEVIEGETFIEFWR